MLSPFGVAGWLVGLTSDLLEQFDEQLDEVWEPFLVEDLDGIPV